MTTPGTRLMGAVALMAGAALGLEVLLIRLLAIIQFEVFTGAIIALALFGLSASGLMLALLSGNRQEISPRLAPWAAFAFALTAPLCWWLAQMVPFHGEAMVWDATQLLWLACLYLLLAVPFFFAGTFLGALFQRHRHAINRLYLTDLVGAGGGAALVVFALWLPPAHLVPALGLLGVAAGALLLPHRAWLAPAVLLLVASLAAWPPLQVSSYKPLARALDVQGAQLVQTLPSPAAQLDLAANDTVPLRQVPGLSMLAGALPPDQVAVYVDGEGPVAIDAPGARQHLRASTDYLPFAMLQPESVAIIGSTGGQHAAMADLAGAQRIDLIQSSHHWRKLVQRHGAWPDQATVSLAAPRQWLATTDERLDLLVLLADAPTVGDFARTRQALMGYLGKAAFVAVMVNSDTPPRASLKLLATVFDALRRVGAQQPGNHLLVLRNWRRVVIVASQEPLAEQPLAAAETFASELGFDLAWSPGIEADQVNRRNIWPKPWLFQAAQALAQNDSSFLDRWKFEVTPTSDNRPRFDNFFRWGLIGDMLASRQHGALLLQSSLLVTSASALIALLMAALLLGPAAIAVRGAPGLVSSGVYFAAIGLGFLLIEIAFISVLSLLLGLPIYGAAAALTLFLVFAGLGSGMLARWGSRAVPVAAIILAAWLALDALLLLSWLAPALAWNLPVRLLAATVLAGPPAFCMGVLFPAGIRRFAGHDSRLVAWAWAVNGAFSVISSVAATLLILTLGLAWTVLAGLLAYALAVVAFRWNDLSAKHASSPPHQA